MAGSTRGRKTVQMRLQEYFGTKNMTETVKSLENTVEGAKTTTEAVAMLKDKTKGEMNFSSPAFINFARLSLKAGKVRKGTTLYNLCHRTRKTNRPENVAEVQTEAVA